MKTQTKTEKCFWCKREFEPTSHNCVHVGGHGDVYGCDDCLGLAPVAEVLESVN